ncbi:hypothetical protein GVO57_07385 [Sphingomonas changnyeongensis]|uniref:Uncharacterized protein n=1 Tax=Sphingomonas changnyeongensis TaxID=2698679 RepID=A0A7Z2S9F6_9SPHN|nr:hypothetical protein [Sphingomonas changnyeongensis]QHL90689.1 hypothetical protein GVO57_07385 [Sphingomonas changnyeongensis]
MIMALALALQSPFSSCADPDAATAAGARALAAGEKCRKILPPVQLTAAEKARAVAAIGRGLRDASSARYEWLPRIGGRPTVCALVNAKNAYGAYAGFQWVAFFLPAGGGAVTSVELDPGEAYLQCTAFGYPTEAL